MANGITPSSLKMGNHFIGGRLLSHHMRSKALEPFDNKPIIVIGNIQNHISTVQREKLGGITFWGGELFINTDEIPYGLTEREFRAFSSVWIRRWMTYHAKDPDISHALETLDSNGIVGDIGTFVIPLEEPEHMFGEKYARANRRILDRQKETNIASGVAVTLCFPKITQPLAL
jgi:hypothetical protein